MRCRPYRIVVFRRWEEILLQLVPADRDCLQHHAATSLRRSEGRMHQSLLYRIGAVATRSALLVLFAGGTDRDHGVPGSRHAVRMFSGSFSSSSEISRIRSESSGGVDPEGLWAGVKSQAQTRSLRMICRS